jgi:hypothetical protein
VAVALGVVVAVTVPLGEAVGVAGRVLVGVPPGESVGGVAEGEDPLQAEMDAEASTVMAAQPIAVNLALSLVPAMVVRISMGPPRRPAGGRSLVPASETGLGTEIVCWTRVLARPADGTFQKAPPAIKVRRVGGPDMQWLIHHWDIRLRE